MKGRLVLVDDHAVVREGLRLLLERDGWEVAAEAARAEEALAACRGTNCDLLLLDLNLDGEDGLALLARIQQDFPSIPVLVLSMTGDGSTARAALRAGARGYVVKSAPRQELLAAVTTVQAGGLHLDPRVAEGVLDDLRRPPDPPPTADLDLALLRYVREGLSNQEIAPLLHLSLGGVKARLRSLFARFGVSDRTALVATALQKGVLPPEER